MVGNTADGGGLSLDAGPQLALDALLHQLVERAQDVMRAQDRLRSLLAAKTVENYVSSLLSTLGMQRRTQAAVYGAGHRSANQR